MTIFCIVAINSDMVDKRKYTKLNIRKKQQIFSEDNLQIISVYNDINDLITILVIS